jgi:hypothetical protein
MRLQPQQPQFAVQNINHHFADNNADLRATTDGLRTVGDL